jgi:hypothetical protein
MNGRVPKATSRCEPAASQTREISCGAGPVPGSSTDVPPKSKRRKRSREKSRQYPIDEGTSPRPYHRQRLESPGRLTHVGQTAGCSPSGGIPPSRESCVLSTWRRPSYNQQQSRKRAAVTSSHLYTPTFSTLFASGARYHTVSTDKLDNRTNRRALRSNIHHGNCSYSTKVQATSDPSRVEN